MKPLGIIIIIASIIAVSTLGGVYLFQSGGLPVIYGDDGEPYVGSDPLVTGIVPSVVLVDSYGKTHSMSSESVSWALQDIVSSPTIKATRGQLRVSLLMYFDRPDFFERHGELLSWDLKGEIGISTDCGGSLAVYSYVASGDSQPQDSFRPFLLNKNNIYFEENEAVYDLSHWVGLSGLNKNGFYDLGTPFHWLTECSKGYSRWTRGLVGDYYDAIRDIDISISWTLILEYSESVETLSGSMVIAELDAVYDPDVKSLTFFESGDIYRVAI